MHKLSATLGAALLLTLALAAPATEPVNDAVVARSRSEASSARRSWTRSAGLPTSTGRGYRVADAAPGGRVGPRSADALGPGNAALEPNGIHDPRLVARSLFDRDDRAAVHADHRLSARVVAAARASPLTGTPIVVEVKSKDDFDKYRGKLRGAIVMNGRPDPADIGFQPEAKRLTDEELKKQEGQIDPADAGFPKRAEVVLGRGGRLRRRRSTKQTRDLQVLREGRRRRARDAERDRRGRPDRRLLRSRLAARVSRRSSSRASTTAASSGMLDRKQPVKLSFTLAAAIHRARRRLQRRRRDCRAPIRRCNRRS